MWKCEPQTGAHANGKCGQFHIVSVKEILSNSDL